MCSGTGFGSLPPGGRRTGCRPWPLGLFCCIPRTSRYDRENRTQRTHDLFDRTHFMFQFLAITKAGCRRLFPRHLLHRITTLTFFIATIVIPQVIYTKQVSAKSSERPNIVLIMADDLGYSDLGCYGGEMATPNIDKLSKAGMSFTQFYNTGRCCPTRASLMTGLYPHNAGIGHMLSKSPNGLYSGDLSRER